MDVCLSRAIIGVPTLANVRWQTYIARTYERVLMGVPNSQLTTNFSAKCQLNIIFFGQFSVKY